MLQCWFSWNCFHVDCSISLNIVRWGDRVRTGVDEQIQRVCQMRVTFDSNAYSIDEWNISNLLSSIQQIRWDRFFPCLSTRESRTLGISIEHRHPCVASKWFINKFTWKMSGQYNMVSKFSRFLVKLFTRGSRYISRKKTLLHFFVRLII